MGYGPYKRTIATDCRIHSEAQSKTWNVRTATAGFPSGSQWNTLDIANGCPMGRYARSVSAQKYLPPTFPAMDRIGGLCQDTDGTGPGLERTWRHRPERRFYRWNLCSGEKRGDSVGTTKKGKGTKIMGLTDAFGLPIAIDATSAEPHEITLVGKTLDACFLSMCRKK
jgi:hypothetical protein